MRALALGVVALLACSSDPAADPARGESDHSSSIAVSADGATVYVVNADADSVSFIDTHARSLTREVGLAAAAPAVDADGRFDPAVAPRALALGPGGQRLYVTGQRSGRLYALDAATGAIVADTAACAEPIGVVASPDGASVFVACSQDDAVVAFDAATLAIRARVAVSARPWSLAWSADRTRLLVTHLLGPGLSVLAPSPLALSASWATADGPAGSGPLVPHGEVRGIYAAVARPNSGETWVAHLMLATDTAQPTLDFQSTAFPALSLFDARGVALARLSVSVAPHDGGAFGDIVSGPRALAFTADGRFAVVADTNSEDLLVVDAARRVEVALVRPLPGHQPEGVAVARDGRVYVDQRNTSDVAVLQLTTTAEGATAAVVGAAIPRLASDPMPRNLRLGQHLFHSANSDELPITRNHWLACASCHPEGRSDAVVWRFLEGPRDTPSNAGGTRHTGFLHHTAQRVSVRDYSETIRVEQGGNITADNAAGATLLDALRDYVDLAIPYPMAPHTDAALVARGDAIFHRADVGCATCHSGAYFTDSGQDNPTLDLTGPVLLHAVGTCNTGVFPDVSHLDIAGHPREACMFDTPTLRGVADTAPYLHDGSAASLMEVLTRTRGQMGDISSLTNDDLAALVEYLRSL